MSCAVFRAGIGFIICVMRVLQSYWMGQTQIRLMTLQRIL